MAIRFDSALPRIWCDFNACGWSGNASDNCYYVLDQKAIAALGLTECSHVFIYDDDGDGHVIGCAGKLESFDGQWRVRPVADSWFRGPLDSNTSTE